MYTPDNIDSIKPNEVFVYGANEAGIHGAGAAALAIKWGAVIGQYGFNGQTYGIPTKDRYIRTLPLYIIKRHAKAFICFTESRSDLIFLITKIGCGLAGYNNEQIAPMFRDRPSNCALPKEWVDILNN